MTHRSEPKLVRLNVSVAKKLYQGITASQLSMLRDLTRALQLSIRRGELLQVDGKWYVSHSGLIRIARRRRCCGIETNIEQQNNRSLGPSDAGFSELRFTRRLPRSLSDTVTQIPPTFPFSFTAQRCESPKLVP